MQKLYLVSFLVEGKKVYKIGITSHRDVQRRFQSLLDAGDITELKIYVSVWLPNREIAEQKEQECFLAITKMFPQNNYSKQGKQYFHNIWLDKKISGITEIRRFVEEERQFAFNLVSNSGPTHLKDIITGNS